jgi:hypothetical protein
MTLDLTNDQACELWMILSIRIGQLHHEIRTHHLADVRTIAARQLERTMPLFQTLNDHITATA